MLAKSLYDYDTLDRRTRQERADASSWNYLYDTNSQLTSAKRKWQDGSFVAGQQYEFEWDSIGNRTRTRQGGDPSGGGLRDAIYVSNALNQYRQRGVPGKLDLIGTAETGTTVTVDSEPTLRQGKYFWKEVSLNNATNLVWATAQVRAVLKGAGSGGTDIISTESRELSVAKTPEIFTHDSDGNLTQDGKWNYNWDAENRLIAIESIGSVPAANKKKFEFAYDGDSRRVRSKAYTWNSGTNQYQLSTETKFIYDGWLCLAETSGSLGLVRSYCWGADLSGSIEGAGGVGGLLWMKDAATSTVYNVSYDGNGNVVKLTKASDGSVAASYEYSPFGELIESNGQYASSNPFRFSTKYQDETGLLYYGYRYLDPDTGRWNSRDPIGEAGGVNLYGFVANDPSDSIDLFGLCSDECLEMWRRMLRRASDLLSDLQRYDPVADGKGGPTWIRGGHFREIKQRQAGLKRDLAQYVRRCIIERDPCEPPCPDVDVFDALANRSIPEPVFPPGESPWQIVTPQLPFVPAPPMAPIPAL